jgi:hypothetical protein
MPIDRSYASAMIKAGSWNDFTAALGRDLAGMRAKDVRIFDCGARYVQVMAGPPVTALETVSNTYLPPDQRLTADEEQTLRRLGWGEPQESGWQRNWRLEYPWPLNASQAAEVARVLTDAIRAVLPAAGPGDLKTDSFRGAAAPEPQNAPLRSEGPRSHASAIIDVHVWSGSCSPREIERTVQRDYYCFEPQDITEADVTWVGEEVQRAWSAKLEEQKSWPARTDWDRLDAAFADLEAGGIMALHEAGIELSDGPSEIATEYHARGAEKSGVVGYCFYHWQDVEQAIMGSTSREWQKWPTRGSIRPSHGLRLAFGDIDGDLVKGVKIGRRVAAAVEASGLRTTWDGTIDKRIFIDMCWQKRYRPTLVRDGRPHPIPMGARSWDEFTAQLGQILAGMQENDVRIFACGARYVQVMTGPRVAWLETASNMFLPPDQSLTADEEQTLRRLGWPEPQKSGFDNWHRDYPWPLNASQAAEVARVLTDAIRAVLPAAGPDDLKIDAFNGWVIPESQNAPLRPERPRRARHRRQRWNRPGHGPRHG